MSKYLIQTTEVYRVDTEPEVENLIAEAKEDSTFDVIKYNCEHKERKQKGDVIDDYYKVSIVKGFTSEKEPETQVIISYEI
jgi:hypothetical protein